MKRIQCKPQHGQNEIDAVDALGVFKNGEIRDVTDGEYDILIRSADFIDADLGYNPHFQCHNCEQFTIDLGYRQGDKFVYLSEHHDPEHPNPQKRTCIVCHERRNDAVDAPAPVAFVPAHAEEEAE